MVIEHGLEVSDFTRPEARTDPVVLTRTIGRGRAKRKEWINYQDTPATERLRAEMLEVNAHQHAASISFVDDGLGFVDATDRWLDRRFVIVGDQEPRFDQAGRLFGGPFQTHPKSRRPGNRLDGEETVTIDFSSVFARIALAEQGMPGPEGTSTPSPAWRRSTAANANSRSTRSSSRSRA